MTAEAASPPHTLYVGERHPWWPALAPQPPDPQLLPCPGLNQRRYCTRGSSGRAVSRPGFAQRKV